MKRNKWMMVAVVAIAFVLEWKEFRAQVTNQAAVSVSTVPIPCVAELIYAQQQAAYTTKMERDQLEAQLKKDPKNFGFVKKQVDVREGR